MKKIISFLLSVVMAVTTLSVAAYAETGSTAAVKDTMTGNWDASGLISTAFYNVGVLSEYNDYSISNTNNYGYSVYKNGRTNVLLNDWNAYSDNWGGINPQLWDLNASPKALIDQRNYGGKNWGYIGKKYSASWINKYTYSNGSYTEADEEALKQSWDAVPDDKWGNCYDITDYVDNGYIVYELDNVAGDTKNAYLAVTSIWSNWCIDYRNGDVPASDATLNKTDHDNLTSSTPYAMGVYGVKLEDYYDTSVGGKQIVKVPIKDFVQQNARGCGGETSTFSEAYFKSWTKESYYTGGVGRTFKPNFFTGAGIARQDSGEGKTFSAEIIKISIVEPTAPANLTAEINENGTVSLNWTASTDSDVSYEITRTYKNNTDVFTAGKNTSYTDTTASAGKGYTYSVAAVDDTYGIKSAQSNQVSFQSTGVSEIVENFALEDIYETTKDNQKPSWETWPSPLAVGPYQSGTAIYFSNDYYAHAVDGKINAAGRPRTYYIHDMYYGGTQNASITYRPQNEGEEGYYASEVDQFWGFNGVIYKNKTNVPGYIKNFAHIFKTGYALFDIKLEEGSSVEDAYLAIVHVNEGLQSWASGHFWNIIGVPLKDYYDTSKTGFRQIAVPLTDFDILNPDVLGVFIDNNATTTGGRHQFDSKALNMTAFGGMGILRKDSRGIGVYDIDTTGGVANALKASAKPFAYTANNLMLVEVKAPEDVEASPSADGITVTWSESATIDVTDYQILRDGRVIAEISDGYTYTDTSAQPGISYTYGVRAVSPTFENVYSEAIERTAKIPNGAETKLFAYNNGRKFETEYTHEGDMTAEFYAKEAATGYIARYGQDGRLMSAEKISVVSGEWVSATLENCGKTDIIKTYLWNEAGKPIANSIVTEAKTPKILAIGNSYSQNATSQLHQIAEADGVQLDVTNMYIGGCTLATHWNNISGDIGAYEICRNGEWLTNAYGTEAKISELLAEEEWDYITVQQASQNTVDYNTFEPYLANIAEYLMENEPSAEIIFHQTWEYGTEHGKTVFDDENFRGEEMCAKSLENARKASAVINTVTGSPKRIIPSGMAVRGVLESNPDYVIWSDGTHLSTAGCYMAGLVWYKTLLGGDILNNKYVFSGISASETAMFKNCANNAVNNYSVVTD